MKKRLTLSISLSVIMAVTVYWWLQRFPAYTFNLSRIMEIDKDHQVYHLADLDADGEAEMVFNKIENLGGHGVIRINAPSEGSFQHNFRTDWLAGSSLFYGDYNRNDLKEIYGFQFANDSLFISALEFPTTVVLDRVFVASGFSHIESSTISGKVVELDEQRSGLIITVIGGYGAQPRKLCLYDYQDEAWTFSADSIQAYLAETMVSDVDHDGTNEIIAWGRATDNNHSEAYFSDQDSYAMIFDQELRLIDWVKTEGISSYTAFYENDGDHYIVKCQQGNRLTIWAYEEPGQISLIDSLPAGYRMSWNHLILRRENSDQFLVKMTDTGIEELYKFPDETWPYLHTTPGLPTDDFRIFVNRISKEMYYTEALDAPLQKLPMKYGNTRQYITKGHYQRRETLLISSADEARLYHIDAFWLTGWEWALALATALVTFGLTYLLPQWWPVRKPSPEASDILRLNTRTGFEVIPLNEILYCRADGKYTIVQTRDNGEVLSSTNLGALKHSLTLDALVPLGRSLIINKDYLRKVDRKKGKAYLKVSEGALKEVSLTAHEAKLLTELFR